MSRQSGLGDFGAEPPSDPFEFDQYGPTADRPLPEAELAALFESGGETIDRRALPDSGLSLSDITDWTFINDEREDPSENAAYREMVAAFEAHEAAVDAVADRPEAEALTDGGEREKLVYECQNECDEPHPVNEDTDGYGLAFCPKAGTTLVYRPDEDPTEVERVRPESAEPEAVADGGAVVEPGHEPVAPVADTDDLPSNEPVRVYTWITGVMSTPRIVEGETSSTGKTVEVADPVRDGKTYRLDTAEILAGGSEYRDSTGFALYTPGEYRATQHANHAPGPQAGANEVTPAEDLPNPTHFPEGSDEGGAVACPACGHPGRFRTKNMHEPRCHACGAVDDEEAPER